MGTRRAHSVEPFGSAHSSSGAGGAPRGASHPPPAALPRRSQGDADGRALTAGQPPRARQRVPASHRPGGCRWVPAVSPQGRLSWRAVTAVWQKRVQSVSLDRILSQAITPEAVGFSPCICFLYVRALEITNLTFQSDKGVHEKPQGAFTGVPRFLHAGRFPQE